MADNDLYDEDDVLSESHAVSLTQQRGYIRTYRAITDECGPTAAMIYGMLEDYAQLGAETGMGCVPSHSTIAKKLHVHRNTVMNHLEKLRDAGWVTWERTKKHGVNRYILLSKSNPDLAQKQGNPCTNIVQPLHKNRALSNQSRSSQKELVLSPPGENPPDQRKTSGPYDLWVCIGPQIGLDVVAMSGTTAEKRALAVCKRLLKEKTSCDELTQLVAFMKSQQWRGEIRITHLETELGEWRGRGSPEREKPGQGRRRTEAQMNAGGQGKLVS
jgi:hypothetical protein